jgi:hypothetical protein
MRKINVVQQQTTVRRDVLHLDFPEKPVLSVPEAELRLFQLAQWVA